MGNTLTPAASRCLECGVSIVIGTGHPVKFGTPSGDEHRIPGLWRCGKCTLRIAKGTLVSKADMETVLWYLARTFIPGSNRFLLERGQQVSEERRRMIEGLLEVAMDAAAALAGHLLVFGPPSPADVLVEEGAVEQLEAAAAAGSGDDPDGLLATIRAEEDGSLTYLCPRCGKRRDAAWLLGLPGLFQGVRSGSRE